MNDAKMTHEEDFKLRQAFNRDVWAGEWNSLPTAIDRLLEERAYTRPLFNDEYERCPGCGSIYMRDRDGKILGRSPCWPIEVDTTQVGYRYLHGCAGYCYFKSMHVRADGTRHGKH